VRRRVTRRLISLQTKCNFLKYSKTWCENDAISFYRCRTGTGNKFNCKRIICSGVCIFFEYGDQTHHNFKNGQILSIGKDMFTCRPSAAFYTCTPYTRPAQFAAVYAASVNMAIKRRKNFVNSQIGSIGKDRFTCRPSAAFYTP